VLPELERSFELLVPTLLGRYQSEPFARGVAPGVEALTDALERELDAAGWDTAHVDGNSLGGWLALELAKRGRARSVVAFAPAGGWEPGDPQVAATLRRQRELLGAARAAAPHAHAIAATPERRADDEVARVVRRPRARGRERLARLAEPLFEVRRHRGPPAPCAGPRAPG
jgi:pimeloyl-ACP methyl ester carboxylesterase